MNNDARPESDFDKGKRLVLQELDRVGRELDDWGLSAAFLKFAKDAEALPTHQVDAGSISQEAEHAAAGQALYAQAECQAQYEKMPLDDDWFVSLFSEA